MRPWELYNLAKDPSETTDVSASEPEVLAQLVKLAEQAHEPVREGTFASTALHERDRRAKFGKHDEPVPLPTGATGNKKKTSKKAAP